MEPTPRSITWEAPEHHHVEKGNDWFFALAIIIVALVIVAILFNDVLFALLIGLGRRSAWRFQQQNALRSFHMR
jgi:hypothetical protein